MAEDVKTNKNLSAEGENKTEDIKQQSGQTAGLRVCYLVDDNKRITSPYFNVYIPDLMADVEPDVKKAKSEKLDAKTSGNEDEQTFNKTETKVQGSILAKNVGVYPHRMDGWVPQFTIDKLWAATGTIATFQSSSTSVDSDESQCPKGEPHSHHVSQGTLLTGSDLTDITFFNLVGYGLHEMDFQELNRKYIKKRHKMYGSYVDGLSNEFVIQFIDEATPYFEENADNNSDDDHPDTSFDNGVTNPKNDHTEGS